MIFIFIYGSIFSDLMAPQQPPTTGSTYGRGGPVPYGDGGGPPPAYAARGGYPGFEPPVGGFNVGRGGGGSGGRGGRGFSNGHVSNFHGGYRRNDGGRGGGGRGFGGGGGGRGGRHVGGGSKRDLDTIVLPKQDFGNLVPFEKNFYVESPSIRAMSECEVEMYRARRDITVEGHDVPKPIRMFHEATFPGNSNILPSLLMWLSGSV